ncbi:MAG: thioredoxin family protein [Ferruginibacter sp.]|nr:thioredoxin family protein [Ferruginibacter sp.]
MRKFFLLFLSFLSFTFVHAQNEEVARLHWEISAKPFQKNVLYIEATALVPEGWHVYKANPQDDLTGITLTLSDPAIQQKETFIDAKEVKGFDKVFEKEMTWYEQEIKFSQQLIFPSSIPAKIHFQLKYEVADDENFLPEEQLLSVVLDSVVAKKSEGSSRLFIPTIDLNNPKASCEIGASSNIHPPSAGLGNIFLLGIIGGLVALLTPCVFPMIPLTVSFFTKKTTDKKRGISHALLYAFFIFLIYVLLSLPFHFLDRVDPEILNNISTNVVLNVLFFVVFVVFALSFFGLFEITLPSSISNRVDSKSGVGTLAGIFFMALTLAIVSFSCTGPILGSLLAGSLSSNGGAMQLTAGMAGFGVALALPFGLFALFPNWLNSLPKSGGWLTTVKVVLGFLELALAFKFLSNADLVKHWGLLKREVFIGLWVIIGVGLTLYLFGKIKFGHDAPIKKLHPIRLVLGIITGLFVLYLLPGLTNTKYANLSLISGFPPPLSYSIYQQDSDCLLGLNCAHDYEEGLQKARAENKPILIDFTGYACVNCRRMEENVWSKPEVNNLMKENFIVVSLYVDDKEELPIDKQLRYITKDGQEKFIRTVGNKWATFETENFKNNAQPLYAILDTSEVLMNQPVGYTPDVTMFKNWLQCGLDAFNNK